MAAQDAVLLALQADPSLPTPVGTTAITDPLSPPARSADLLDHFFEAVYDKRPESHLSRFLKALLGDSGAGQLRKRYIVARMQQVLLTTHFTDLDSLYGALFGFRRLTGEWLDFDPYFDTATPEEWDAIHARDASYRNRVEQFSRALPLGATKAGMEAVASALLGGVECTVYETYMLVDENGSNPGGAPPPVGARTYGDVQSEFRYYGEMQRGTYGDVEGGTGSFGRTTSQNRSEFIVRPKRGLSLEETYELIRVLNRLKPAEALLTVDPQGVAVHTPVPLRAVAADSTYWEVETRVAPAEPVSSAYLRPPPKGSTTPLAQPRPAFSGYQGEAWSYNSDVTRVSSYTEEPEHHDLLQSRNYQRVMRGDTAVDYTADRALMDPARILLGRYVSDGVLVSAPYAPSRLGVTVK